MRKNRNRTELRYNCNGIPVNRRISLALLRVMGVDDPFEGRRYDPQFEDALVVVRMPCNRKIIRG